MHVIVGSGPLGRSVMKELIRQGIPFRVVNRSGRQPELAGSDITGNVNVTRADLMEREQCVAALKGAKVIYQCSQPLYHQWMEKFERLQDHIVEAAAAAGAKLVAADNMYAYGKITGEMTEELPHRAETRKGRLRARMVEQLLDLHRKGKLQAVIARGSDFYGPGVIDSAAGGRLFGPLVRGRAATIFGDPSCKHSFTYIDDFGRALVNLGLHEDTYGQVWHVPNAAAATVTEFVTMAAQVAGVKPVLKPMGLGMMRIGGLFIPAAREGIEMFYQFDRDFLVNSQKYRTRFGEQATGLEEGLAATVAWYKNRG